MTLATILSKNFLFDSDPALSSSLYISLLVVFGLMIVLAIAITLQKAELKKIIGGFFISLISTGILGLIYLFASYESLPYLSSRFFLALIVAMFTVWNIILLVKMIRFVPKHLNSKKTEDRYNRYLPKSKTRNGRRIKQTAKSI